MSLNVWNFVKIPAKSLFFFLKEILEKAHVCTASLRTKLQKPLYLSEKASEFSEGIRDYT